MFIEKRLLHSYLTSMVFIQPLNDTSVNSHSKVYVKSLEEIKKEKQSLKLKQEKKPQEEQTTVPLAGIAVAEPAATVTVNLKSPLTSGKNHPVAKRLLVRSQDTVPERVKSKKLKVSSQPVERKVKGK